MTLVLSLFPGIGLLDRAFEEEGFCVVRGPDLLWGGDIRRFHPPAGKFDGVIGGPPCQAFSSLARLNKHLGASMKFGNLIPQFERVVGEAAPDWWLMENVVGAPIPEVVQYGAWTTILDDVAVGGVTRRRRRITRGLYRGTPTPLPIKLVALQQVYAGERAVTGNDRVLTTGARIRSRQRGGGCLPGSGTLTPLAEMLRRQGLPADFFEHTPFTEHGKRQMLGNGVPMAMGLAIAKAVKKATP